MITVIYWNIKSQFHEDEVEENNKMLSLKKIDNLHNTTQFIDNFFSANVNFKY